MIDINDVPVLIPLLHLAAFKFTNAIDLYSALSIDSPPYCLSLSLHTIDWVRRFALGSNRDHARCGGQACTLRVDQPKRPRK